MQLRSGRILATAQSESQDNEVSSETETQRNSISSPSPAPTPNFVSSSPNPSHAERPSSASSIDRHSRTVDAASDKEGVGESLTHRTQENLDDWDRWRVEVQEQTHAQAQESPIPKAPSSASQEEQHGYSRLDKAQKCAILYILLYSVFLACLTCVYSLAHRRGYSQGYTDGTLWLLTQI